MQKKYITPSLLNLSQNQRIIVAQQLLAAGIEWIHYDVMDGEFVPNLAISPEQIKAIKTATDCHIADAHLMVKEPQKYVDKLLGVVDYITLHFEALDKVRLKEFIINNKSKFKIGLAIKPATQINQIFDLLKYLDLVLIMSVEPGAGGQSFQFSALDKIRELKKFIKDNHLVTLIQVDGGINDKTATLAWKAGADALVAGTYLVFEPTISKIKTLL